MSEPCAMQFILVLKNPRQSDISFFSDSKNYSTVLPCQLFKMWKAYPKGHYCSKFNLRVGKILVRMKVMEFNNLQYLAGNLNINFNYIKHLYKKVNNLT